MDYSKTLHDLTEASLFDLYRLSVAIRNELENPIRLQLLRRAFKEGDTISYFSETRNALQSAVVLQKNPKYVVVRNSNDQKIWKIPYYLLNLAHVTVDIHAHPQEKLSKNHLKIGDCVGFDKDGEQIVGVVIRLNQKTASLATMDHRRWRVSYSLLFRVFDVDIVNAFDLKQVADWIAEENAQGN